MRTAAVLTYFLIINIAGFVLMGADKRRAKRDAWRIPERNFFIVAILGGALGCYAGMQVFHHKTLHKAFIIGMPTILMVQILVPLILYGKGML